MQDFSNTILSIGCDWITITQSDVNEVDAIRETMFSIANVEVHNGMFGRPWSASGYDGFGFGHGEYGERWDGCIARLHGVLSHAHWHRLFERARNCSRLDLEVTVKCNRDVRGVLRKVLRKMHQHNRKLKVAPQLAHRVCSKGGVTIYSGSPASDQKMRIYDKGIESGQKQFASSVRFEIQYGGKRALLVARSLFSQVNRAGSILSTVLKFALSRGAPVRRLLESLCPFLSLETCLRGAKETDVERRLQWIRKAVAPGLKHLIECKGRQEVLRALGIPET